MPFSTGRKTAIRLTCLACGAAIALALAGCEGNKGGSRANKGPSENAGPSGYYEHEVSAIRPPSTADVREAQRTLASLGYDPGPIDGVLGKRTRIAIRHFQVDEELEVNGELTPGLLNRLGKASRTRRAGPVEAQPPGAKAVSVGSAFAAAGPIHEVGDVYVYSDGKVETAMRVGPEQVFWESADGSAYTAFHNIVLPPISWKSGSSSGENRIEPAAGEKWPLAANEVSFSVASRAAGSSIYATPIWSGKWRCASGGIVRVNATAGAFEAVTIECDRANPAPGTWKKRIWHYVPEVGHYVRRTDIIHGTGHKVTVDLVAVRPGGKGWPPAARGGLDWAIQGALESGKLGEAIEWRSSAVGAAFHIRLVGEAPVTGNAVCRRYVIERTSPDQVRHFPAIACKRAGQERWLIPGLEPDTIPPSSLKRP